MNANDHAAMLSDDTIVIFLFHGVIQSLHHEIRNYTRKHISVERFEEVLDALAVSGTPVSMPELVAATLQQRALPPRAFVVTFDDGFANNYAIAAPILERRRMPATFYVTSGFVEHNGSSWTDLIEHAFEGQPEVAVAWGNGEGTAPVPYRTYDDKRQALDEIRAFVKRHREIDPYTFASSIRQQLGVVANPDDAELDRKMSWSQVRELSEHGLFTVGGHGHTHRILEFLPQADLEREVAESLDLLRRHVGRVTHYSYPEGLAHCYSPRVIALLRAHGICCAPTAEPGVNRPGDDLFHLKRVMVA
jgi:peptidoglycan/xylan/chitin deacetylase (PgdA/CDA1 family)